MQKIIPKAKSQKGVTMIILAFSIMIMMIIVSIIVFNAKNGLEIQNLNKMNNDISLLEDKIAIFYSKYGNIPAYTDYEYTNTKMLGNSKNPNDNSRYYIIDLEAIENLSLNYGKKYWIYKNARENNTILDVDETTADDVYIINEETHTIYYPKGIEFEGKFYYTVQREY